MNSTYDEREAYECYQSVKWQLASAINVIVNCYAGTITRAEADRQQAFLASRAKDARDYLARPRLALIDAADAARAEADAARAVYEAARVELPHALANAITHAVAHPDDYAPGDDEAREGNDLLALYNYAASAAEVIATGGDDGPIRHDYTDSRNTYAVGSGDAPAAPRAAFLAAAAALVDAAECYAVAQEQAADAARAADVARAYAREIDAMIRAVGAMRWAQDSAPSHPTAPARPVYRQPYYDPTD